MIGGQIVLKLHNFGLLGDKVKRERVGTIAKATQLPHS